MSTCSLKSTLVDINHLERIVGDLYGEYASFRAEVAESHPDFSI